jgi:hypothetical protein
VQLVPPASLAPPLVSGTPLEGETLTAGDGVWSSAGPLTLTRRWQRCDAAGASCVDVAGAIAATYVLGAADVASTLRVVVTASTDNGSASAASAATPVVAAPPPLPPPVQLVPPASLERPLLAGVSTEGETLTASDGVWSGSGPLTLTHQWQRCAAAGDACVDVGGSATYVLGAADVGSTIRVVVTAAGDTGSASAASDPSAVVAPAPPVAPQSVGAPELTGAPQQGVDLAATDGAWSGSAPLSYAYRWARCHDAACVDIPGAVSAAYVPVAEDVGAALRVQVTASNAAGSAEATSAVTAAVLPLPPAIASAPVVSGGAVVGDALTATTGTWTATPAAAYAYRWQRCSAGSCVDIAGEIGETHVASVSDIGSTLRAVVTATDAGGATSAPSAATERIAPYSASGFGSWQVGPYAARADAAWDGLPPTAQPPTIAIVDSGVDPTLPGLEGVVTRQVTLASVPQASVPDGYGHGSFVASVAAGRAPGDAGAAPTAHVVSLDVMDDQGMAMTSDVIAAADWIYAHKDQEGIRVANFSLLGASPSSIQFDPLDKALERLWLSGVVVVTAAGNYGSGAPSEMPFAPANDPFVITVGAADVGGTVAVDDDVAAPWSAYGHTPDGFGKPELGAPGRFVVAPVPTASTLYLTRPDRIVSPGRMQLSGTSFAAPVVSGIAADLLALHPDWTPDQVKGALMLSAAPAGAAAPLSLGVGEVDAAAALAVQDPPNPSAGLEAFLVADPAGGPTPVFDGASWGTAAQANASWGTASWGTASWGTASWGTASWGTSYWSAASWGTASWGTASWGTASWGTSVQAVDNAAADASADGGYWRQWPG